MRILLICLSATAIAGLGSAFAFHLMREIGVLGGTVQMPLDSFIALVAIACFLASLLALVFRRFMHAGARELEALNQRVAQLENAGRG